MLHEKLFFVTNYFSLFITPVSGIFWTLFYHFFRCLPKMPSGEQKGSLRSARLRSCLGRVQSFVPLLLHVALGEAEQPLSTMSTGMVHSTNGKIILAWGRFLIFYLSIILGLCFVGILNTTFFYIQIFFWRTIKS